MQVTIRKVKNNKALKVLSHEGRFYAIAPMKGAYEIELVNNCPRKRLAVVSVDGLSVMTGEQASKDDMGYVLYPNQRVVIKGWRRDDNEVARFEFKPNDESYSEQMGHGKRNTGVIGVAVFEEKDVWRQPLHIIQHWYHQPFVWPRLTWCETVSFNAGGQYNDYHHVGSVMCSTTSGLNPRFMSAEASFNLGEEVKTCGGLNMPQDAPASTGEPKRGSRKVVRKRVVADSTPTRSVDLGTGYGERAQMSVRRVDFQRASVEPQCVIVIEYGTKERLKEKGIPVDMVDQQAVQPEPFPGNAGCPAPAGWRG